MGDDEKCLDAYEVARLTRMEVTLVRHYAEIGLVAPTPKGYSEAEVAELRRVRRLHEDLGLDHEAIEIVLRMARRIRELSEELRRLGVKRPAAQEEREWTEAEWEES